MVKLRNRHSTPKQKLIPGVRKHSFGQNTTSTISSKKPKRKYSSTIKKNINLAARCYSIYLMTKLCEICKQQTGTDDDLLLCDYCDDAYHRYCLPAELQETINNDEDELWMCPVCQQDQLKKNSLEGKVCGYRFQTTLDQHNFQIIVGRDVYCEKCNGYLDKKQFCFRCQRNFHIECFNKKKKNAIICFECEQKQIQTNENTLLNYFQSDIKFFQQLEQKKLLRLPIPQQIQIDNVSKKLKKKYHFKLPIISTNHAMLLKQKQSLYFALTVKNIQFDDDLRFSNSECPPMCNNASLEPKLQKMNKENCQLFYKFKEMSRIGNYAPLMIEQDKLQGFIVRAYEPIPEYTFIAEYVGEVDFARKYIFSSNDSIMDLLRTSRSSTSLVIHPEKYGNLARFLSGINNNKKQSKQKQNVASVRYNIDGHARVILYTKKAIKRNQILYYDYNAGGFDEYPTENFV